MKNEALYNRTVDILVRAYFNDTLEHGNQCGCAVGNIIAENCGIELGLIRPAHASKIGPLLFKDDFFYPKNYFNNGLWYTEPEHDDVKKQVDKTGYSMTQLLSIEKAFESERYSASTPDGNMFNGLMAVIETLDQIHENTNSQLTETSKKRFSKQVLTPSI